jgi:hypothetical protein
MPDPNTDMMTSFLNANYIRAEDLQENVLLEKIICEVKSKDFDEDGEVVTKPVIAFEDGSQLVLNQTRLRVLIGAHGPNANNLARQDDYNQSWKNTVRRQARAVRRY